MENFEDIVVVVLLPLCGTYPLFRLVARPRISLPSFLSNERSIEIRDIVFQWNRFFFFFWSLYRSRIATTITENDPHDSNARSILRNERTNIPCIGTHTDRGRPKYTRIPYWQLSSIIKSLRNDCFVVLFSPLCFHATILSQFYAPFFFPRL